MITSSFDLFGRCEFVRLTEELASLPFTCGDSDQERTEQHVYDDSPLHTRHMFLDLLAQ